MLPLELPEIRHHIAQFLHFRDCLACSRVSRAWRHTFEPWIWLNVSLFRRSLQDTSVRTVGAELLQRHSSSVQKLVCTHMETVPGLSDSLKFESLRVVFFLPWVYPQLVHFPPLDQPRVIQRHRETLTKIHFSLIPPNRNEPPVNHSLWEAFASCPLLQCLNVTVVPVSSQDWTHFQFLWSRLSSMLLRYVDFQISALDRDLCSTTLKSLTLVANKGLQSLEISVDDLPGTCVDLELMKRCGPDLKTLVWRPPHSIKNRSGLGKLLLESTRHCPNLVNLTLGSDNIWEGNEALSPLSETSSSAHRQWDSLKLAGHWSGEATVRWIETHLGNCLSALDLRDSPGMCGRRAQSLLCSLPALEDFAAPWIQDIDVLEDPRPWACTGLVKLKISVILSYGSPSNPFVTQLARLESLERLTLTRAPHYNKNDRPLEYRHKAIRFLELRLCDDLNALWTLRNLEGLDLADAPQELGTEDIEWMLSNWPRLRYFYGILHPNMAVDKELRRILNAAGVEK